MSPFAIRDESACAPAHLYFHRGQVGLPLVLGFIDGTGSNKSVKDWYPNLRKPPAVPPPWAFPVAWTALYMAMGLASHLIVNKYDAALPGSPLRALADSALKLYWGQFALNLAWSPVRASSLGAERTTALMHCLPSRSFLA